MMSEGWKKIVSGGFSGFFLKRKNHIKNPINAAIIINTDIYIIAIFFLSVVSTTES